MVEMPNYVLTGPDGPVSLAEVFDGRSQLIVYNHMWTDGAEWQCPGCTGFTSQFTRLEFLDNYDARFVIVTNGPIDEALAYKPRSATRWSGTRRPAAHSAPTLTPPRVRASASMSFCATAIPSTAPGTPTAAAPSNSATHSP